MIYTTFDWWVKLINITLYVVLKVVYIHVQSTSIVDSRKSTAWLIYDIFYALFQILVILIWSSLDALQFRQKMMLYFGVCISLIFTLTTIYISIWSSSHSDDDDDSVVYFGDDRSISLISLMDSALRVVTIFLWKQTIVSIVNRKHKKCILISYTPFIEWVETLNSDLDCKTDPLPAPFMQKTLALRNSTPSISILRPTMSRRYQSVVYLIFCAFLTIT